MNKSKKVILILGLIFCVVKPLFSQPPVRTVLNHLDAEKYFNEAMGFASSGDYQKAIVYFEKALEINPNYDRAYYNLGLAHFSLGQYREAITYCEKAIEINPAYLKVYRNLGDIYISLGRYKEAIVYWEKAIEINPDDADSYADMGVAYEELGQYQKARQSFIKAKQLFQRQDNFEHSQMIEKILEAYPK